MIHLFFKKVFLEEQLCARQCARRKDTKEQEWDGVSLEEPSVTWKAPLFRFIPWKMSFEEPLERTFIKISRFLENLTLSHFFNWQNQVYFYLQWIDYICWNKTSRKFKYNPPSIMATYPLVLYKKPPSGTVKIFNNIQTKVLLCT